MTVRDQYAHAGAGAPAIEATDEFCWQDRSCEELRAIASRGVHGGDAYFAAVAELERRARDSEAAIAAGESKAAAERRETVITLAILFVALQAALILRLLGL